MCMHFRILFSFVFMTCCVFFFSEQALAESASTTKSIARLLKPATRPSLLRPTQSPKRLPSSQKTAKVMGKAKAPSKQKRNKIPTTRGIAGSQLKKAEIITVKCKNRKIKGHYCVGRTIGPVTKTEVVRCPFGNEMVQIKRIFKLKVKIRESDLRPDLGRFGQKDYIWICPKSSYAAFPEDFFKPFDKKRMEIALRSIRKYRPKGQKIPGWYRYLAASAGYWARRKNPRFFARLFLRATWAAREDKNKVYEKNFRGRALSAMQVALKKKLYPIAKRPSIFYLIAELYRQDGQFSKSLRWIDQAYRELKRLELKTKQKGSSLERMILRQRQWIGKRDRKVKPLP